MDYNLHISGKKDFKNKTILDDIHENLESSNSKNNPREMNLAKSYQEPEEKGLLGDNILTNLRSCSGPLSFCYNSSKHQKDMIKGLTPPINIPTLFYKKPKNFSYPEICSSKGLEAQPSGYVKVVDANMQKDFAGL